MASQVTRRELALGLAAAGVAGAQAPALPANPDEETKALTAQNQRSSEMLRKFEIPLGTEPAFTFKA